MSSVVTMGESAYTRGLNDALSKVIEAAEKAKEWVQVGVPDDRIGYTLEYIYVLDAEIFLETLRKSLKGE